MPCPSGMSPALAPITENFAWHREGDKPRADDGLRTEPGRHRQQVPLDLRCRRTQGVDVRVQQDLHRERLQPGRLCRSLWSGPGEARQEHPGRHARCSCTSGWKTPFCWIRSGLQPTSSWSRTARRPSRSTTSNLSRNMSGLEEQSSNPYCIWSKPARVRLQNGRTVWLSGGGMLNYIIRRLIIAFFLLIGIGIVSFIVIKLPPGDFATRYQQYLIDRGTPQEEAERAAQNVRKQYDLDKPAADPVLSLDQGYGHRRQIWLFVCLPQGCWRTDRRAPAQDDLHGGAVPMLSQPLLGWAWASLWRPRKYGFWDNFWAVAVFYFHLRARDFRSPLFCLYVLVIKLNQPSIIVFLLAPICDRPLELGQGRRYVQAYLAGPAHRRAGRCRPQLARDAR